MKVRVSIANLAWFAQVNGSPIRYPFGVVNEKKLAKGERQYQALGGGAMLTGRGKRMLEFHLGATNFEFDSGSGFFDARFVLDEEHVETVWNSFWSVSPVLERNPTLDIIAELTGSESGHTTILTEGEVASSVLPIYVTTVRQKLAEVGTDTSARASGEMPTHRLFRIFSLLMSGQMYDRFASSSRVRLLTDLELATTDGGCKAGRTDDGFLIQNNLFLLNK